MTPSVSWLNAYAAELLNLWSAMQVQTAVFVLLVWLIERALPREWATPRLRYLLWSTVLLKAVIPPVLSLPGTEGLAVPAFFLAPVEATGIAMPGAAATAGFPLALAVMVGIVAASLLLAAVAGWRAIDLRRLLRTAVPFPQVSAGDWPPVFISDRIPSPLATGIRHPRIYITPAIATAPPDILHAVLQHERAHIRRRDSIMVAVQTFVQILYVLNPMMWMANLRIFRYRELICDEEAIAAAGTRPQDYGRLLVDFAEAQPARILQTGTCFFETRRGFVQRVSELFNLDGRQALRWKHYTAVVIVTLLILPLSWHCERQEMMYKETLTRNAGQDTDTASEASGPSAAPDYPITSNMEYVKEGELEHMAGPRIEGGLDALRGQIKYPETAMRDGIEGVVIVEATVTKDGPASAMRVLRSVHPALDKAALAAVKGVRFKAGHRNGKVIESTISIPIKFKLQ